MVPHPLFLEGAVVALEPLEREHVPALMAIARADPEAYRFTSTPITDAQRDDYFGRAFDERDAGRAYPLAVRTLANGELVGTTRFADLNPRHRNLEIGYTWYRSDAFGSGINVECKYLMLRYAFEELALLRAQIHTDTRNERSQHAIRALGAQYEGVLRRHMVAKDGVVRDTVVFAITDLDWPTVRHHLEARLLRRGVTPRYRGSAAGRPLPHTAPDRERPQRQR